MAVSYTQSDLIAIIVLVLSLVVIAIIMYHVWEEATQDEKDEK